MRVCLKVARNGGKVLFNGQMGRFMKEIGLIIRLKVMDDMNGQMVEST